MAMPDNAAPRALKVGDRVQERFHAQRFGTVVIVLKGATLLRPYGIRWDDPPNGPTDFQGEKAVSAQDLPA